MQNLRRYTICIISDGNPQTRSGDPHPPAAPLHCKCHTPSAECVPAEQAAEAGPGPRELGPGRSIWLGRRMLERDCSPIVWLPVGPHSERPHTSQPGQDTENP